MGYEINCTFITETEKAIHIEYGGEKYWLPKIYCSVGDKQVCFESGEVTMDLEIDPWLAYEKGISDEDPNDKDYPDNCYDNYEDNSIFVWGSFD